MIFQRHVVDRLAPYVDGNLDSRVRDSIDAHLAECTSCRSHLDQVRTVHAILREVPVFEAPESLWAAIEEAADGRSKAQRARPPMRRFPSWRYAMAAIFLLCALGYWKYLRQPAVQWEVAALDGSPLAGKKRLTELGFVRNGEWIETDAQSRARIRVGEIGSVEVEPDTAVRLVDGGRAAHRLALRSGEIRAKISAPPRLFFVDTPAGTAVDLGCEYQLRCDRSGAGTLNVTQGWVSLEWKGRESLVPAGASCRMRPALGPGTPWFDDAPAEFVQALERFDLNPNSEPGPLEIILSRSRARDTLTLWHLLSRVRALDRSRIYDAIAHFTPPPAPITKQEILSLDRQSLMRWKDELAWTW